MKLINKFVHEEKYTALFIILIIITILMEKFVNRYIINVSVYIYAFYFTVLFIFIYSSYNLLIYHLSRVKVKTKIKEVWLYLIKVLLMSYLIFNVFIYSIFNSISYMVAESKSTIYENCKIIDVTSSVRNHAIYYEFRSKAYRIAEYSPRVGTLSEQQDFSCCSLMVSMKKGIFDTYKVDGWEIIYNKQ